MSRFNFSCVRGETTNLCIHCEDSDGNPLDLGAISEITFTLKRSTQDLDSAAVFQGTLTNGDIVILGDTKDGICSVTIPKADTETMMLYRIYYWSVQLDDGLNQDFVPVGGILIATFNAHE